MQSEMCQDVVANPVFRASHAEQRDGTVEGVGHDGQVANIKPKLTSAVLQIQLVRVLVHVTPDDICERTQLFSNRLGIELGLKHGDAVPRDLDLLPEIRSGIPDASRLDVLGDFADGARLKNEILLLHAKDFILAHASVDA